MRHRDEMNRADKEKLIRARIVLIAQCIAVVAVIVIWAWAVYRVFIR